MLKDFLWKDEMLSLSETFYRDSFSQVENAGIWTVQQVCCLHLNYNSAIKKKKKKKKEKKKRD